MAAKQTSKAMSELLRPKIEEVLEAFRLLQNDGLALDYCGIGGTDRMLILNDIYYQTESKKIKARKFAEEIQEIDGMSDRIRKTLSGVGVGQFDDNGRMVDNTDPKAEKEMLTLQMKAASMRRDLLSLSSVQDTGNDETEALNVFFIPVTAEEFETLKTVEVHYGEETSDFGGEDSGQLGPGSLRSTMEQLTRGDEAPASMVPEELEGEVLEYVNEKGELVIEEI